MHFGRVQDDKNLDLSLPPIGARTKGYLNLEHKGRGLIYCGAPIWACKEWQDTVYPAKARPSQYLRYYAQAYSMIELNSSFYRIPTPGQVGAWRQDVGPEFKFCPKVAKDISHQLTKLDRVKLGHFLEMLDAFGENLGLSFMQLPEWFTTAEFPLLEAFAAQWPRDMPLAIEFRHPSWFQDHMLIDPVINFLYRHNLATVITDTPGERGALHMALTYPSVLLRFMGLFPSKTDQQRLKAWLDRLEDWAGKGMDAIYIAIHQERNGSIPQTIDFVHRYLYEKKVAGVVLPAPAASLERNSDDGEEEVLVLG